MQDLPSRPLIVASLIVRDEEALLPECLTSLKGVVDDIVVCDTGSRDRTIEIAGEHGATVVEFPWIDDFSAARNAALAASQHGSFVLWIDADERLAVGDVARLRKRLETSGSDAFAIEVESQRTGGPTSIGLATRIFRSSGARFEGALHEHVVRIDGQPLSIEQLDLVRLTHLGYDESVVAQSDKADRNLRIAAKAHEEAPSGKTALDLGRSLANCSTHPAETLAAIQDLLGSISESDPSYLSLRTLEADFSLQAGDLDNAITVSLDIITADQANDVAAAVFARAATDAARQSDLRAASELIEAGTDELQSIAVPVNRALALALLSAAAGAADDLETAVRTAERCWRVLQEDPVAVRLLVDAYDTIDPEVTAQVLTAIPGLDAAPILTGLVGDADTPADAPTGGITLDFDDLTDSADHRNLVHAIPPTRRVHASVSDDGLVEAITAEGHRLVDDETVCDVLMLEANALDAASELLANVDTAGLLFIVDAAASDDAELDATLVGLGFMADPIQPAGARAYRPIWTADRLLNSPTVGSYTSRVLVRGQLDDDRHLALRASLPSDVEILAEDDVDQTDDDIVLSIGASVVPEPGWVQALWDSVRLEARPVGCRVVGRDGRTIAVGHLDGNPIGTGEPPGGSVLASDRHGVALSAPYAAPAHTSESEVVGRLRSDVVAVDAGEAPTPIMLPGLRAFAPESVVFLGGSAPGHHHPEDADVLAKTFAQLVSHGITPVFQWDEHQRPDTEALREWRSSGVVVFAPPPSTNEIRPDPLRPQPAALVQAFAPGCIVYLTANALGTHFRPSMGEATSATQVYAAHQPVTEIEGRIDVKVSPSELADRIVELHERVEDTPEPAIPPIASIEATAGLTSIVIPVFNRSELTAACLDSIERHTNEAVEIIVVDNGSTDDTAAVLERWPQVKVIRNEENRGFPAAVNQGFAASTGEYVCVLNNDTEATSNWLQALHHALAIDGTGLVGPRTNEIGGLQRVPDALSPTEGKRASQWAWKWTQRRRRQTWTIDRVVGFCFLIRRSTLEQVGGFDESFGIGNFEDDELCRRVQALGLSLRVTDESFVLHHGSATFSSMNVDLAAALHRAGRTLAARGSSACAATCALVLSDGQPIPAVATAASAQLVADQVRIVERSAVVSTELAAAPFGAIDVLGADWTTDEGSALAFEGIEAPLVLVLEAGERLDVDDWGAARAEIDSSAHGPLNVSVGEGAEVRVVTNDPASIRLVGGQSPHSLEAFTVDRF